DPLLDLVRIESWTLPACPAMIAPFRDSYARVEVDASRRRAEIYEIYLLLAGIVWYRSNELPERERFCRERLVGWLAQHSCRFVTAFLRRVFRWSIALKLRDVAQSGLYSF